MQMVYIPMAKLVEKVGSIYKLCNVAALRAQEINAGATRLIEITDPNAKETTIALKEILGDKVMYQQQTNEQQ